NRIEDFVNREHEAFLLFYRRGRPSHWYVRLELPDRPGHLERRVLSPGPWAVEGLRRADLLRRALHHGGGELDVLRPAACRSDARVGRAHARRFRVLGQAVSKVHAPTDVPGAGRTFAPRYRPGRRIRENDCQTNRRGSRRIHARDRATRQQWETRR